MAERRRRVKEKLILNSPKPFVLDKNDFSSLNESCKSTALATCKLLTLTENARAIQDQGNGCFCRLRYDRCDLIGLLTAGHVLPRKFLENKRRQFKIEAYIEYGAKITLDVCVADFGFRFTCPLLDMSFLCCKLLDLSDNSFEQFKIVHVCEPYFKLEDRALELTSQPWLPVNLDNRCDRLCVFQFNNDGNMEAAYSSDEQTNEIVYPTNQKSEVDFWHKVSTEKGTSGALIAIESNGRIIGLHKEAEEHEPFNVGLYTHVAVQAIESCVSSPRFNSDGFFYNPKTDLPAEDPMSIMIHKYYEMVPMNTMQFCAFRKITKRLTGPADIVSQFPMYLLPTNDKLYTSTEDGIVFDSDDEEVLINKRLESQEFLYYNQ